MWERAFSPPPTITGIEILTPATATVVLPQGTMLPSPVVVQATFSDLSTSIVTLANGMTLESNQEPDITVDASQNVSGGRQCSDRPDSDHHGDVPGLYRHF